MSTFQRPRSTAPAAQAGLCGWAGRDAAEASWDKIGHMFPKFQLTKPGRRALRKRAKTMKVRFSDLYKKLEIVWEVYYQKTGDCVSWGAKRVIEMLAVADILMRGDAEEWKPVSSAYLYAIGRVLVGANRLRGQAGSLGSWQALAVVQHGIVALDETGLPKYSGQLADAWGDDKKYEGTSFRDFLDEGANVKCKTTSRITAWEELEDAYTNFFPVTIASNQGFEMEPGRDGFHRPKGQWPHQMSVNAVIVDGRNDHVEINNQWNDVHGVLKDFDTGEELPRGTIRCRRETFEDMMRDGECIVYSGYEGFPGAEKSWDEVMS